MARKKTAARSRKRTAPPKRSEERGLSATVAIRCFEDQTRRMLGTHYANKYGVRRGR